MYKLYLGTPRQGSGILLAMIVLSLLVHAVGYVSSSHWADTHPPARPRETIKIRIQPKDKKDLAKKDAKKAPDEEPKKIFESPLAPTLEKPKDARHAGAQDHKAEKETRVASQPNRQRGMDPGQGGEADKTSQRQPKPPKPPSEAQRQAESPSREAPAKPDRKAVAIPRNSVGRMSIGSGERAPRNEYEKLMPTPQELADMRSRGYQDHMDDEAAIGDRVDINTTNYRYIGYFSGMRKAIELAWIYPSEAIRRGLQGEVNLEFTINKDGSTKNIKVLRSSGYKLLDNAIVEAIRAASPFAPLPDGFGKKQLVISGAFRYILTNYAGN